MNLLRKAWDILMKLVEYVIVFGLVAICLILLYQVISRYLFNKPLIWSEELSLFLLTWVCFIGVSYGIKHRMHIRMSSLVKVFPLQAQKFLAILVDLLCIGGFLAVMPDSWAYFLKQCFIRSPGMQLPYGFVVVCLPVGFALAIISLLMDIGRVWQGDLPTD
ncbi:TRAP transporter small permease [Anaerotruncus sp. AF02-27]|uniref:TRAP transporter small permease n=1 Tax=Anaerotruncus TaxID=244127 RepID=UPI000E488D51|nr:MULTISPECIES: TRAP transporter small permease [Anaerotruncus]RGX54076.1 TRAP transporter small permease [Anaerotruncus sp. AF02-27]